ncbi:MAG TPA: recombinase family protein [Polyangiaceae bacterium]|nr:recombinase family protein [Polyangiaceae bacterium]
MTTTSNAGIPVAIYARYSTDRQDARSIDDQMRRCRAYAATHGYRVIAEYQDAAISGAHVQRADMQRLLTASRAKGGAPFRAVLLDDLSRLSRDLGNTWQIVFHDLASADVKVIDVTTGMASDGAGARLTFGAMALVNDTFLQLVRAETHRGLEGRALGGFWTGGRCYGYVTVQEVNPPDREHPRKRLVVEPTEAAVVVRIFQLFADGMSLKKIAALLNHERIAAPHDNGRGNKIGNGWGHPTIRAMIRNERYRGQVVWNQTKHVRVPGRKSRRRVIRPKSEWIVNEYPELVIVSKDLWDTVQARIQRVYAGLRGRPAGTGPTSYLLSGLMRCGVCGGSMTITGRKLKNGVPYSRFGCTTHYSRGSAVCANNVTVSEKRATRILIDTLKEKLDQPNLMEHFVSGFTKYSTALRAQGSTADDDRERRIRDCERRIANLTESLAKVGWSEALAAKLREEEGQLGTLRSERQGTTRSAVMPHPTAIASYVKNLFGLLETDPTWGREWLARFVSPVVMTPEVEGPSRRYRATGAFDLSFLLTAVSGGNGRSSKVSCAGWI